MTYARTRSASNARWHSASGKGAGMTNTPLRNDSGRAIARACELCGDSFVPQGRRRFCDDACRQAARREWHPASTLPPLPCRVPRSSVIYECPECEARFLGEQRCDQCEPVVMDTMKLF